MTDYDRDRLAMALHEVVGMLVVSARSLVDEPAHYGPMRLLDAAERVLDALEEEGITTPDTPRFRDGIESALDAWGSSGDELVAALDAVILDLVD